METFLAVAMMLVVGFAGALGASILLWILWTAFAGEHERKVGLSEIGDDVYEHADETVRRRKRLFLEGLELLVLSLTALAVLISWSSP